jgi:hypothetical protein
MRRFTGTEWGIFALAGLFIIGGASAVICPTEMTLHFQSYRHFRAGDEQVSKEGARLLGGLAIAIGAGLVWLIFYGRPTSPDATIVKNDPKDGKREILPLLPEDAQKDWVTILAPHSEFQADIVIGRLKASGIAARLKYSKIGAWVGGNTMGFVQVRPKDYDAAKDVLNEV